MSLLDVSGLTIGVKTRHGTVFLVEDVSFSIGEGEVLGVAGESGAGKSLTGLALLGLLEPPISAMGGEVWFEGERIDGMDEQRLRKLRGARIATVFQDSLTSLNPLLTVEEHLIETIRTHLPVSRREARERTLQLLVETGIPAPATRLRSYPHELSGGMRQRVVLALAFACEPKLIVGDEPTTALDVSVQAQVIDLLFRMREERKTSVLLITHDMGVMAEAADRLAIMYAGRIVEIGPADTILKTPRHPYTQGLIAAIPRLGEKRGHLRQIQGVMAGPGERPAGCAFHPRCPEVMPRCLSERPGLLKSWPIEAACWLLENSESSLRSHDRALT